MDGPIPPARRIRAASTRSLTATATAASAAGRDQAQSPANEAAAAATTQPARNPSKRPSERFSGVESCGSNRWRAESKSIADKTALAKFPVITAVEMAPGTARRRRAYWQAMADTAIIAAVPASNPTRSANGLVMELEVLKATSRRN